MEHKFNCHNCGNTNEFELEDEIVEVLEMEIQPNEHDELQQKEYIIGCKYCGENNKICI